MKIYSAPTSLCFTVTGKCNQRCRHCGVKQSWGERDMSTEKMLSVIDEVGRAKVFNVSIFGGEPLVKKDLPALLERFRKYKIKISMNTNATLMTDKMAKMLIKDFNIRSYVVSIDGAKGTHERQRGKNTFDRAVAGIKNIIKYGGQALLSFTVTKLNIGDIEKVVKLGKEIGASSVRFNHVFYGGNAACFLKEVYVSPDEERKAIEEIVKLSKLYPGFITGSYLQQNDKLKGLGKFKPKMKEITVPPCGAATSRCAIRPDGSVTPCEVIWEVKAGSLYKNSFKEIWKNSKVLRSFRKDLHVDITKMPECVECEHQYICFWGHRCYPYHYPGGIKNTELYCWKREN